MFYAFGFERIGVIVSDLYFVDPDPNPGQPGAERGVRVEVRFLEAGPLKGSIYSARPIAVDRPIWRGDLLESVASRPGSFDRTHHHPAFDGWEPSKRVFVPELSAAPIDWVEERLSDPDALLAEAGIDPSEVAPTDVDDLRAAVPEIMEAIQSLLDRVHMGVLARPPVDGEPESARVSWL
jgi:hypothetical protein